MARDLDGDWILGCQSIYTLAGDHAQHQNDKQCDHGDSEGSAHTPTRSAVCFFIFFKDGKRMDSFNMCLRAGSDESADHKNKDREENPEGDPVQPFNVAGLRGGRVQHVMATRIEWHSLSQRSSNQTPCRVHFGCSGTPVIPFGVCSGVEDSAGLIFIWSVRFGETPLGSSPAIDRT